MFVQKNKLNVHPSHAYKFSTIHLTVLSKNFGEIIFLTSVICEKYIFAVKLEINVRLHFMPLEN